MTQPPLLPAQQISLLDIYTKQVEMGSDLRILKETLPDHESRIRKLEQWRYGLPLSGLLALASIALSVYSAMHH